LGLAWYLQFFKEDNWGIKKVTYNCNDSFKDLLVLLRVDKMCFSLPVVEDTLFWDLQSVGWFERTRLKGCDPQVQEQLYIHENQSVP
jgi:hypothetical protein